MKRVVLLPLLSLLAVSVVFAADPPARAEIEALVAENMRATGASDLDAVLATIHPESLARPNMAAALGALSAWKLRYEVVSIEHAGMTGPYALIRVVQRTRRVEGPEFTDNELDGVWALRLDGMRWKYWSQMVLDVRPLTTGGR